MIIKLSLLFIKNYLNLFLPNKTLCVRVAVNSLIYTIKKEIYNSNLEEINYNKLELLSLVIMPFCHAWATVSQKELQDIEQLKLLGLYN